MFCANQAELNKLLHDPKLKWRDMKVTENASNTCYFLFYWSIAILIERSIFQL